MSGTVDLARDGHVAVVTLQRPDKRNALNGELIDELATAFTDLGDDPDVRAVVVTGAGPAFCAGADLTEFGLEDATAGPGGGDGVRRRLKREHQRLVRTLHHLELPTVAAVNGAAIGGGLDLVCAADLAVVSTEARLGVGYTARGLVPDMGGLWLLPRLVGERVARELVLTGRVLDGTEAAACGLVNRCVPPAEVLAAAVDLASRVAANPPIAVRLAKLLLDRTSDLSFEAALDLTGASALAATSSADAKESLLAHQQRRQPQFTGT